MKINLPESLKSRKLWLALIAAFVAFGNAMWSWGLTNEQVQSIISPLLVFIGVEGAGDVISRWRVPQEGSKENQ